MSPVSQEDSNGRTYNTKYTRMKQILLFLILACCISLNASEQDTKKKDKQPTTMNATHPYQKEAKKLVNGLKRKGIRDERVLQAILTIPRHAFVAEQFAAHAYDDKPLPIDRGQTISQPYTVAFQTELLQVKSGEKVLEIGTGSGYQAAVLCELGADVYSIERHYPLYQQAKDRLIGLNYSPKLFYGDGYEGLPDHAPFDKILITAATPKFPEKLLEQLKVGGLMVAPIGDDRGQTMTVVKRVSEEKYKESTHGGFIFVPMKEGVDR